MVTIGQPPTGPPAALGQPSLQDHASGSLRIVVLGLVVVAVLCVLSVTLLAYARRTVPDTLIGLGSAAVGALSTLVLRTGKINGG